MSRDASEEQEYRAPDDDYNVNKTTLVARKVVRFILSNIESQNTILSRNRLQNVIREVSQQENCVRVSFTLLFDEINKILRDVYGYELRGLPPRFSGSTVASSAGQTTGLDEQSNAKAQHFIVLNDMPFIASLDNFKLGQSVKTYEELIVNGEYVGDDMSFESENTVNTKLNVDQDLALKGLLSVILCIILFSKNNILQGELTKYLEAFGVPIDGSKIPILKLSIEELLKLLDRLEYIVKLEEKSDMEGDTVSYRIGRRTQAEFELDSLVTLVQEVMGLSEGQYSTLKEDIEKSIADSYMSVPRGL